MPTPPWSKRSLAVQAMGAVEPVTKAVVPPIHLATTFIRDEDNAYSSGFVYGRPDNATVRQAESVVAMLEDGPEALFFASGMAAATAVFQALDPGDHVVAPRVMYWALRGWLASEAVRWGLRVDFVETDDLAALAAAVRPGKTKLVWIETPANPLWTITDIAAAVEVAHRAGARLAVDSTAASPVHTRPLALGADVVMHAATKILNGHSDVVAGALVTARQDAFWARVVTIRKGQGAILGPFEAYLLMRGLRTLHLRAAAQAESAQGLAERLSAHPNVARVLYPGLPQHPGHDVAARQMEGGFGTMLSIQVSGGDRDRRPGESMEARHLARRRRKPDRAPRLDRRPRHAMPAGPAAALDRDRGWRGPLSRSRRGAEGRARLTTRGQVSRSAISRSRPP